MFFMVLCRKKNIKIHSERITREDKNLVTNLNYDGVEFPVRKFEYSMDLLLLIDKINNIVCISKSLTDLCFTEQRIKTKNTFIRVVYSVLVVKMYRQNIKKFV